VERYSAERGVFSAAGRARVAKLNRGSAKGMILTKVTDASQLVRAWIGTYARLKQGCFLGKVPYARALKIASAYGFGVIVDGAHPF